jgi:hypothetical protein
MEDNMKKKLLVIIALMIILGLLWGCIPYYNFSIYGPIIAMNSSGATVVVWRQGPDGSSTLWAKCYDPVEDSWTEAVRVDVDVDNYNGTVEDPHVAIDPSGNIVVVWEEDIGLGYNIFARYYKAGDDWSNWSEVTILDESDGQRYDPKVAMDASGNAIVVWMRFQDEDENGITYKIWSNRYNSTIGQWEGEELISKENEVSDISESISPNIAMDQSGNAIVVWTNYRQYSTPINPVPDIYEIWTCRYVAGQGWEYATLLHQDGINVSKPFLAMNPSGDAIVVWEEFIDPILENGEQGREIEEITYKIWSRQFKPGSGWQPIFAIKEDLKDSTDPRAAINSSGDMVVTWKETPEIVETNEIIDEFKKSKICSKHFNRTNDEWTDEMIVVDNVSVVGVPEIVVDDFGNALIVWCREDKIEEEIYVLSIYAVRYVNGTGWNDSVLIDAEGAVGSEYPRIAMDSFGNAMAVWEKDATAKDVWVNQFR